MRIFFIAEVQYYLDSKVHTRSFLSDTLIVL